MAVNAGSVYAELILDASKYEENLKKAEKQAENFQKKLEKTGKNIEKAGKDLSKYVTAPVVAVGALSTKLGMDFEAQMSRVQAISGATGAELEKLNEVALQLGADTAFSASEVASAMENLASAGFTTNEIIAAIPGNLDLAAASGTDLATATDIAASILRGFQLDASEAGRVADVLAEAANRTNAQVEDMGEAMKYIAPVANAMGMSLEETAAAVGILSDAGIKGSQAGTTLRTALTRLTKPTKQMQKVMNELGLEFFDAQGNMKPLTEIIAELEEGTKGLTQEQKNQALSTLFGQEALSGMLTLIEEGPGTLAELTKGFKDSSGAAEEAADIMMNNTKGSIEEMMGALETAGIKIFQAVAPTITDLATKVGELADKFSALPEETQKNIIKFAGLAAAIGPLLIIGRKFANGLGSILGLFGRLTPALGTATKATDALTTPTWALGGATKASTLLLNPWVAGLAAAGVAGYGLYKHLNQEAIPAIDLFGSEVSESTKQAVGGFLELNDEATLALNQLSWSGQEVTKEMAESLIGQYGEMNNQILTSMRENHVQQLESTQQFFAESTALTEEEEVAVMERLQEYQQQEQTTVQEGQARIAEILNTAKEEKRGLKESERQEINEIQKQMTETAVEVMSESEVEQKAIMERLKQSAGDITARQAAEVVQNSAKQKEETIQNANEQYIRTVEELDYLKNEAGAISDEQYQKLKEDAEKTRDDTVAEAEKMHGDVVAEAKKQAGEHVNEVDWETGEIKTKWQVMKSDVSTKAKEIKEDVVNKWEEIKKSTAENWGNVKKSVSDSIGVVKDKVSEGINKIRAWNRQPVKEKFSSIATKIGNSFRRIKDSIQGGIDKIRAWNRQKVVNKVATFTQKIKTIGSKLIGRNARGTNYWRGGLTWVGEQGPELIELPRGSKVYSNQKSTEMASSMGRSIVQNIHIHSPEPLSPSEIARKNLQVSRQLAMEWGL